MEVDFKTCSKCKETKSRAEFYTDRRSLSGLQSQCKPCVLTWHKASYKTDRAKFLERKRIYHAKFRTRHGVSKVTARCKADPQVRLASILRTRLYNAIKRGQKTGSAVRDLGMPIAAFLTYLNLDALDKYGIPYTGNELKFHIDHIRPLISFDLEDVEQLRQAVNWKNLQVLRAEENLQKGARHVQLTTGNPATGTQGAAATP